MSSGSHFYDEITISDNVRKLSDRKAELLAERAELAAQQASSEERNESLKKEFNLAGAMDLVRFFADEAVRQEAAASSTEGVSAVSGSAVAAAAAAGGGAASDPRFLEANAKLEVKILNETMSSTLPGLEIRALELERKLSSMRSTMEGSKKAEAGIPTYMLKSLAELQREAAAVTDSKLRLKASIRADVDDALMKRVALKQETTRLRQKLDFIQDEEWSMRQVLL
jgi:hypothetical protein